MNEPPETVQIITVYAVGLPPLALFIYLATREQKDKGKFVWIFPAGLAAVLLEGVAHMAGVLP